MATGQDTPAGRFLSESTFIRLAPLWLAAAGRKDPDDL